MKKFIIKIFENLRKLSGIGLITKRLNQIYDIALFREYSDRRRVHINPLNKSKFYGFSQHDEDGITLEIFKRIGLKKGFFVEFGPGNGLENNTIILLASGWNGAWFGGQAIAFDISQSTKLQFERVWITKENIIQLYESLNKEVDVVSLDLDGNDIYLIEQLLTNGVKPKLFIVEYNAKFPPPIEFRIDYDEHHNWTLDDYFGASLSSFNSVFTKFGYRLVCCDTSGSNAFFIHKSYEDKFADVPNDINEIYSEPFNFTRSKKMNPTSAKTIEKLIK